MLPSDVPFMTTVKCSPEEWHEVLSTMNATKNSGLTPVQCLVSLSNYCSFIILTAMVALYSFSAGVSII